MNARATMVFYISFFSGGLHPTALRINTTYTVFFALHYTLIRLYFLDIFLASFTKRKSLTYLSGYFLLEELPSRQMPGRRPVVAIFSSVPACAGLLLLLVLGVTHCRTRCGHLFRAIHLKCQSHLSFLLTILSATNSFMFISPFSFQ